MFRNLYVSPELTAQYIAEEHTKLKFVMGEYDRVVELADIRPLLRRFPKSLINLPVGHTGLLKAWVNSTDAI